MGTRSDIIRENADGSYDRIYCHWDGYPSHNGKILLEHYQDEAKVGELIALGDLSCLGEDIGEKHDFDTKEDGSCTAYGRDRGETGTEATHHNSWIELRHNLKDSWTEYCYVYKVSESAWYWTPKNKTMKLKPLTLEVCKD